MSEEQEMLIDIPPETGPADGMDVAREFIGEVEAAETPPAAPAEVTDLQGRPFDLELHKTDSDGTPLLGSRNQLLLKKEAKRSARQRIEEGINRIFRREKAEADEIQAGREIPLSDHELDEMQREISEKEVRENLEQAQRHAELTSSAENSADLYFLGGSMVLGIEFLNQRNRFHPQVAAAIYEYERRTGRSIDLPPGVALAAGLGRIGWEIVQREPACKERLDIGCKVIRVNAVKYIGHKFPKFGRKEEGGADD